MEEPLFRQAHFLYCAERGLRINSEQTGKAQMEPPKDRPIAIELAHSIISYGTNVVTTEHPRSDGGIGVGVKMLALYHLRFQPAHSLEDVRQADQSR